MISVVVVNWNTGVLLSRCVRSLVEFARDCRIVVVDNASDDDSWRPAAETPGVAFLRNRDNEGFAAACNRGWRAVDGDPVLFLNPDAEASAGAVGVLAASLVSRDGTWAVAGALTGTDGKPQRGFNVRRFPSLASVAVDTLLVEEIWPQNPWTRRHLMLDFALDGECDVEQPAAACLMVRRSVLERLEGFDAAFTPAWFEDVDLCRRIHDAGGSIRFLPGARFVHRGGTSLARLPYRDFLWHFNRNRVLYFRKHHGEAAASAVRRMVVLGMLLRAAAVWRRPFHHGLSRREARSMYRDLAGRFRSEALP